MGRFRAAAAGAALAGMAAAGVLAVTGCSSGGKKPTAAPAAAAPADPYLWLEDVEGAKALEWVRARNAKAEEAIQNSSDYKDIEADLRKTILAPDRLPMGSLRAGYVYNFWQDDKSVRGLWRRATLDEYGKAEPAWETLLDLDALAAEEKENWVFKGASCLPPNGALCILSLSRGGKDAIVLREFDVASKSFVKDGFVVPEAKSRIGWIDDDTVWVGTNFGPGTMTKSGYPRQARIWKRGQKLLDAKIVLEGKDTDLSVDGDTNFRPEGKTGFVTRSIDFYSSEVFRVGVDQKLEPIPVPSDAQFIEVFEGRYFFSLRSTWTGPTWEYPAGSFVAILAEKMTAPPEAVFVPSERTSFRSASATRTQLLVSVLDNVQEKVMRARRGPRGWKLEDVRAAKSGVSFELTAATAFDDRVLAYETGFLTPPAILSGDVSVARPSFHRLRSLPARFDAKGLMAEQREARSKDGTMIPYFVVRPRVLPMNGSTPTLLYGYGGFEISQTPDYLANAGKPWLEKRKAVYVLANIRGGGEFGPRWHKAALQENRQKAFDDFEAVAQDLIARKITSPAKLGIMGGSNGGLLVGTVMVQRPELFGAVVCQVPLLDMFRYHKLLAGFSWMAEYGDPDDPKMAEALAAYSPYQNAKAGVAYPKVLFLTSTKDDRVHPGHARKMMAKLESFGQPALLWENVEGGHGGAANLEQRVKFSALSWAFLWKTLSEAKPGAVGKATEKAPAKAE